MKNISLRRAVIESKKDINLNPEESLAVLNALLVGYEFMQCLDLVTNTTLYRQNLKEKINSILKELEKSLSGIAEIMDIDNEALYNFIEHKEQLMKKIAVLRPEHKSGLNNVLDEFFSAPELTIHRLGIKIIDRDKSGKK